MAIPWEHLMSWDMERRIHLTHPSTEPPWVLKNMPQPWDVVLEKKILWQWLERNFHHWRNEGFWRALPERTDFLHYVPFLVMWFTSYLQICICHCGACLKGDTLVQHPAFPGLHVRCQSLLNGYFLDGGFPVLCGWLVCTDKVITTATARKNKTAAKQEGWKSTFYSWWFLLV